MTDPTRVIETPAQLQDWISRHPDRHQKVGPQECSCGWPGEWPIADMTWEAHESVMLIHDLGDVLPSDTHELRGPAITWRDETERLTKVIDTFHANCTCEFEWPDE